MKCTRIVEVKLLSMDKSPYSTKSKTYGNYFFKTSIDDLQRDELVVFENRESYALGNVVRYVDYSTFCNGAESINPVSPSKWVFGRIDLNALAEMKQRGERLAAVKAALDKKVRGLELVSRYALVAQTDPEAADLLEEFKQLTEDDDVTHKA